MKHGRRASGRLAVPLRATAAGVLAAVTLIQAPDPAWRVETMVRDAENLAYFEAYVPARAKLDTALRAARRLRHPGLIALCVDRIGSVLDSEGQTVAGAERHQQALAQARAHNDQPLAASILASIGLAHWRHSEYPAALVALHEALTAQEKLDDPAARARTLVFIGRVHFKKAEYHQAKASYRRAAEILDMTDDRRWLSIVLEDLGDLAIEQGFFVEALDRFEQALAVRRDTGDGPGEVYMLTVIGRAYLLQGAYREALAWLERALALSEQIGDRPTRALALYHMGIAYDELAEPVQALALYVRALALKEELGDRRQQAWILRHMGDAHAIQQDLPSALDAHRRAIRIWEQIRDPRGVATGLSRIGFINLEMGRYTDAIESLRRASELLGTSHPAFQANALAGIGKAFAAAGDEVRAIEHARRAVDLARHGPDDVRWTTLRSLGWIERRLGHREDALVHYRESLAVIETLRGRVVPSAGVREGFLEGKQAVYGEMVDLLIDLGRVEEALEVAERSRARAFLDLLAGRKRDTKPADEAGRWGAHPDFAKLGTTPPPTFAESRAEARRSGGTILSYFSASDQLFIWVLSPDGTVRARTSRISRRALSDLVGALRSSLRAGDRSRGGGGEAPASDAPSRGPSDARSLLRRLYGVLIEPVGDLLPRDRERLITIVPHGPLFLVSFAALLAADGHYVVERHTLAYSPSIGVLRHTGRNRDRVVSPATPRLLVAGNPAMPAPPDRRSPLAALPGAESEAQAIGQLYRHDRATVLIGARASERAVRAHAPSQTIIHLATHAVILDDQPMDSYLALAPDPPRVAHARATVTELGGAVPDPHGDGVLTVAEVFGFDLQADLTTLSACNTGLGRISGEGVVGLSRAFIYAGTASVLVSLWRVADNLATTQMERFYKENIRNGGNKAAALAAAQREMLASLRLGRIASPSGRPLTEDPLLWAPFVLIGEARSR